MTFQDPTNLAMGALKLIAGETATNIERQRKIVSENDVFDSITSTYQLFAVILNSKPHFDCIIQ